MCFIHGCKRIFPTTTDYPWLQTRQIQSLSLSLSISIAQIWEVLHPWLNPTLQIHDSSLFLYKWALEIAERGKSCRKSCRSFFVLGATIGTTVFRLGILLLQGMKNNSSVRVYFLVFYF
ncbi:uncharacterized protein LOC131026581 [Salvia miltiorrhiza]|uniref:uncharacterized protein LOC131026581 n=1 Tax=Salvia miltiorrhiza TaxID=226208 RepID=UPI0025AC2ED7|nr:uncharacterized protein LOC131026581 [Salvia miltiorrhiza]